jgi:exodeoxyribonuclease V alpha subunit
MRMQIVGTVSKTLLDVKDKQVFVLSGDKCRWRVVSYLDLKVTKNDPIIIEGDMIEDLIYGKQFRAEEITFVPVSTPLLKSFLKTGTGIGNAIVDRLIKAYGYELIDILENNNITALSKVQRISEAIAIQLCRTWHTVNGKVSLIQMVEEKLNGYSKKIKNSVINSVTNAYSIYGEQTALKLIEDPFRIWSFASWRNTEIFAQVMGIKPDDERRLVCAVEEALHRKLAEGHTVARPLDFSYKLRELVGDELLLTAIIAANHVAKQKPPRIIVRELEIKPRAESSWAEAMQNCSVHSDIYHRVFSLSGVTLMEKYVENQLKERLTHNILALNVSDEELDNYLMPGNKTQHLSKEQKKAVQMVLKNSISVVCGPAGTGKTSVLYCVNEIIKSAGNSVLQVALAGKAAQRLIQQTDDNAYTIKSLLNKIKYQKQQTGTNFLDHYPTPVVHIDEASMVDLQIMYEVLKAFEGRTARFVFIGDPGQLPPIGIGLVFHCLIKSNNVPKIELTTNFRSVKDIIIAANKIRKGASPQSSENVIIESYLDQSSLVDLASKHYLNYKDENEVHIIAARKSTVSAINSHLHCQLTRERDAICIAPQFSIGDSVIYKKNDADLGLVNGSTGVVVGETTITSEDGDFRVMISLFNGKEVMLRRHEIQDDYGGAYHLHHAYGITCHAAQGSEFDTAIIVVEKSRMVERSWLYTAITRAKYKVVLLVEDDALNVAVNAGFKADYIEVGLEI